MELALLALRVVVGLFFVGHGAQKLFGSFGGHGVPGTAGFMESLGLKPGRQQAIAAGTAEFAGGALLVLGLGTPLAAAMLIGVMTVAIVTVHAKNGPWVTDSGWEYNAVLIAVAFALAGAGPGEVSLDHAFGWMAEITGTGWALGALAAGVAGGFGAVAFGRAGATREQTTPMPAGDDVAVEPGRRFERGQGATAAQEERPGVPADPR
jgi:putative oxidoreductase